MGVASIYSQKPIEGVKMILEKIKSFASNSDHIKFHKEKELEYKCQMSTKNTLSSINLIL